MKDERQQNESFLAAAIKRTEENLKEWTLAQLANCTASANAAIERVETSLLTEFHKWASPNDQKLRTHREALRALDLQIEQIAERVGKLEATQ
jgi:hypothetical protein